MPEKKPDFDFPEPEIIAEGVTPEEAIAWWKQRARLTDAEARALDEGARRRAFYVTGLARRDLVQLVSDGIQAALENGETLPQFRERIKEAIQAQGWHERRVELIFRTNMHAAYAAGRWKKIQAVKEARPYLQYVARMIRTRPGHAILHLLVYPVDHEFWKSNYPPNGFRCHCDAITLSARQVERRGLTVQKEMPKPGVWTDPKTGMEYFVHFPGADKGFRSNPGRDWLDGLDLTKYPDLNKKSYEEQRGPASRRPAPVKTYAELEDGIKSRLSHFATNNGITSVTVTRESYFMATYCDGRFMLSERDFTHGNGKTFNPAKALTSAWNKLAEGKSLTWEEEYACESLWHEITHNREKRGPLPRSRNAPGLRYMETVTQWTARRTYHHMLESLGGKAAHQADIKKNGLGYGLWIRNFDKLVGALKVNEDELLSALLEMIATRPWNDYGKVIVETLSQKSGIKKSVVRAALSGTGEWDYDQVLRSLALIE